MNRTLKEATVSCYHDESPEQLREHLKAFIHAYNYGKRLNTLKELTPYEFILKVCQKQPKKFIINPNHFTPGPYIVHF